MDIDSSLIRWSKVKKANEVLKGLVSDSDNVFLVHYSCESFQGIKVRTGRITSIAIRNFNSAQTKSFSVCQYAEILKISDADIMSRYDEIEKRMLEDYFLFLSANQNKRYVHWNMRDVEYGFEAIEQRGRVVGCSNVFSLPLASRIDLARLMVQKYGASYIEHPRLEKLIDANEITKKEFLGGGAEAQAFIDGDFRKLHQSTLRKVDSFESIIDKAFENKLKVKTTFQEIYGLTPQSLWLMIKGHWIVSFVLALAGIIGFISTILSFFN